MVVMGMGGERRRAEAARKINFELILKGIAQKPSCGWRMEWTVGRMDGWTVAGTESWKMKL